MGVEEILNLAERHGLLLQEEMRFNEMGLDFRVVFATQRNGEKWVLRIPRRDDLVNQIKEEKNILNLVSKHLSVGVPDWKIATPSLIAYPLMEDKPILTFDSNTQEVFWNMDKGNPLFLSSLAKMLWELHQIPIQEASSADLKILTPESARQEVLDKINLVKRELGIGVDLENRWRRWVDNDLLWPDFTCFIHGDLYAGHILTTKDGDISGVIDWSEGQVNDSSTDFSGHFGVFGEESLKQLIGLYEEQGGKVWEHLFDQTVERHVASPLNYGYFALQTENDNHILAAKAQLKLKSS